MPVYNNAIPQPTDDPSESQDQILQNFQTIYTVVGQDHMDFNTATEGKHKRVTFPVGPVAGQPFTFLANEIGLQSLNQSPTSRPDIWMTRGTGTAYPITGYANGVVASNTSVMWTYLPSGILRISGQSITSAGTRTITFGDTLNWGLTSFPGFSQFVSNITITPVNPTNVTTTLHVNSFNLTQVVVGRANGTDDLVFFWSAEGF